MKKLLFCFGTRPEAIKMAPIITEAIAASFEVSVCITGQHKEMLTPFMNFFEIKSHYSLDIMKPNQSLLEMTSNILMKMKDVLDSLKPDMVIVQGDTTTTFTCALAAFYYKIPVAHIEAGLRTYNKYSPFPEEINRRMVTSISDLHFAPTITTERNLFKEGVLTNVFVTGNTSIDALKLAGEIIETKKLYLDFEKKYSFINFTKKIILVTTHRRENHGQALQDICNALKEIVTSHPDVEIIIPVHLNPHVKNVIEESFKQIKQVHLTEPLEYPAFVWFMQKSYLIITDSGGVQEEGPYFNKPILVIRENTERPEGIEAGTSKLIGTKTKDIVNEVNELLKNQKAYQKYSLAHNPYGDGSASAKILKSITKYFTA